jgi:hypothetical protein
MSGRGGVTPVASVTSTTLYAASVLGCAGAGMSLRASSGDDTRALPPATIWSDVAAVRAQGESSVQ